MSSILPFPQSPRMGNYLLTSKADGPTIVDNSSAQVLPPLQVEPFASPRFEPDDPALIEYLHDHGYAIVKNVCSQEELNQVRELFWQFLSDNAGMLRDDSATWTDENFCKLGSLESGILFDKGIGQADFLWYLRLLPRVKLAFSKIFGTMNLITSFDGGNVFRPWHSSSADVFSKTKSGWYHVDQGRLQRGMQCVQGLVTLYEVTPQTGGFCVIPGSHLHHNELLKVAGHGNRNFISVPRTSPLLRHKQVMPICEAGDMVLWDSRTIHCNSPALETPTSSPDRLLRMVGYVCMTPKSLADNRTLSARVKIFERGLSTSHWPHLYPYDVGESTACVRSINDACDEQKALIGVSKSGSSVGKNVSLGLSK